MPDAFDASGTDYVLAQKINIAGHEIVPDMGTALPTETVEIMDHADPVRLEPAMEPSSKRKTLIHIGILAAVALISIFFLARLAVSSQVIGPMQSNLDAQESSAAALAASAAGLSIGLAAVPTDATTPVANQLANLGSFFIVSLAAIMLQKVLLTAAGYIAFTLAVPAGCALGIAYKIFRWEGLRIAGIKLAIFGLLTFAIVPTSLAVVDAVNSSHEISAASTIGAADETAEKAKNLAQSDQNSNDTSDGNIWDQAKNAVEGAVDSVTGAVSGGLSALDDIKNQAVSSLNSFMEWTARLIITTCVIPILTVLAFSWVSKLMLGFDTQIVRAGRLLHKGSSRGLRFSGRTARAAVEARTRRD